MLQLCMAVHPRLLSAAHAVIVLQLARRRALASEQLGRQCMCTQLAHVRWRICLLARTRFLGESAATSNSLWRMGSNPAITLPHSANVGSLHSCGPPSGPSRLAASPHSTFQVAHAQSQVAQRVPSSLSAAVSQVLVPLQVLEAVADERELLVARLEQLSTGLASLGSDFASTSR